jgi:hypothetical protein
VKVIKNLGLADGRPGPAPGQYLKWYNPEALGGMGDWGWTRSKKEALKFEDTVEAFKCYTQVPNNHPTRSSDGQPNKPFTSFTISIEEAATTKATTRKARPSPKILESVRQRTVAGPPGVLRRPKR